MSPHESWHLITGEYPPARGGVSDYTRGVAEGLADRGCDVHVWCPSAETSPAPHQRVTVHPVAGQWSRADLRRLDALLDAQPAPRRLLVQWVPHAFGRRSLNIGFCRWVRGRSRKRDTVEIVAHEAFHAFGEGSWRQDAAAAVHRVMVTFLLSGASRVWVTIPAWAARLRPYARGRAMPFCWLPVPSNVPFDADTSAVAAIRAWLAPAAIVVGHFGTFNVEGRRDLSAILPAILDADRSIGVLLIGRDSDAFLRDFTRASPALASRVAATGMADAPQLSHALQACDLVAQPYPDGASTRRTTLMAALSHGIAAVTTSGRLSDPTWSDTDVVVAVDAGDHAAFARAVLALSQDAPRRARLAACGRELYRTRFDLPHVVESLLNGTCQPV